MLQILNHIVFLLFWMTLWMASLVSVFFLAFSNWLNFSDAWNVVFPSLAVANDKIMKVVIAAIKDVESTMSAPHHFSHLIAAFDYGHGFATVQTIVTFCVETVMAWAGIELINIRHAERSSALGDQEALRLRAEKERTWWIFGIFAFVTLGIWLFDFSLTYAKQVLVSKNDRFTYLGPLGTILIMTLVSVLFAFSLEKLRNEISAVFHFTALAIEGWASPPAQTIALMNSNNHQELGRGAETRQLPNAGVSEPAPPPAQTIEMIEIYGANGIIRMSLEELNQRFRQGILRVNGLSFSPGSGDVLTTSQNLHQLVNPEGNDGLEWYYTTDGYAQLDHSRYVLGENNEIIRRH